MKTAISIPDSVFDAAENLARRLGVSRSELYRRAIKNYVQAHRDDGVTDALNRAYANSDSALPPDVLELQTRSLPREDW